MEELLRGRDVSAMNHCGRSSLIVEVRSVSRYFLEIFYHDIGNHQILMLILSGLDCSKTHES